MLIGLNLPSVNGGTEAGVQSPHQGNCLSQRETFKAESETADLWPPKWNENQTVLAQPHISRAGIQVTFKVQWLGAGV